MTDKEMDRVREVSRKLAYVTERLRQEETTSDAASRLLHMLDDIWKKNPRRDEYEDLLETVYRGVREEEKKLTFLYIDDECTDPSINLKLSLKDRDPERAEISRRVLEKLTSQEYLSMEQTDLRNKAPRASDTHHGLPQIVKEFYHKMSDRSKFEIEFPKKTPGIQLEGSLEEAIETRNVRGRTILYLDGINIVSYSTPEHMHNNIGLTVHLPNDGIEGYLTFNRDFFTRFDIPKRIDSWSDMRNIAKAYFKVNSKGHVALTQYMEPAGESGEHYHRMPEVIVQIAGSSCVEMRPVEHDTERRQVSMNPGDMCVIPAMVTHKVIAYDKGSVTVPIKQTLRRRSDHHYQSRSEERMREEVGEITDTAHYNSGDEMASVLHRYQRALNPEERETYRKVFGDEIKDGLPEEAIDVENYNAYLTSLKK